MQMATKRSRTATLAPEEIPSESPTDEVVAGVTGATGVAEESDELSPASEGRQWYVIHTYSGYENKVKANLEHRIETMDAKGLILQVVIPTEDEIEIREGQRRTVSKKIFPGYVLVQM